MKTTSPHSEALRRALEHPTRGVIGLVDDLLQLCSEQRLQLDWQGKRIRLRSQVDGSEEVLDCRLSNSIFRAVLARVATLCNERIPNSVSPYGGQGELLAATRSACVFRVMLQNTPDNQCLELLPTCAEDDET